MGKTLGKTFVLFGGFYWCKDGVVFTRKALK